MEYRTKTQTQAKMVKWRDVDGPTIVRWVEQVKCGERGATAVFAAGYRRFRKHRRFVATTPRQRAHDRLYTFNSA